MHTKKAILRGMFATLFALCGLLLIGGPVEAQNSGSSVYVIDFNDMVHGVSADFIQDGILEANAVGAELIVLKMQTPGGLITSMEEIIQAILASEVPVAGFVAPSGAKAASAGFYILMACDVAVMAPGTRTGSATPVMMTGGGGEENENLKNMLEKIKGDSRAFMRSLVRGHLRNPDVDIELTEEKAVEAIDDGASFTEKECLDFGLINFIAGDVDELLQQLDGQRVRRFTIEGQEPEFTAPLQTASAEVVPVRMDMREQFLSYLSNPMIALFLGAIGLLGLYLEFSNPGLIFPGAVGAIALIMAAISFQILTVNWAGLLLVTIAFVFFILEVQIQSYGLLTIGGIVALIVGGLMLFEGPIPEMRLSLWQMLPFAISIALITLFLVRLVITAHFGKVETGIKGLVGAEGEIRNGKVFVHGEIWNAQRGLELSEGEKVIVEAVEGLRLNVRRQED